MSLLDTVRPAGCEWTRLRDCYEVTRKPRGLDTSLPDSIPFVPMDAIPQGGPYAPTYTLKSPDEISSGVYFERGDLLVARITPSFENGKQALALDLPSPFGYATTEVIPLRPRNRANDGRFLFFYLLHPDIRHFLAERMEGATGRQRIPEAVLLDLPIPDVPLDAQVAIANALEAIQGAAAVETRCVAATQNLKRAAMHALFTRGLRGEARKETDIGPLPESWDVVELGSLGRVGNGSTPKRTVSDYWAGGTFPWLTSAKVYDREIVKADQFVTEQALAECHLPRLQPGTVLVAITGQGKTLGHCAVLAIEATISQHLAYIAVSPEKADPFFVRGYIETQYSYLRRIGAGGGSTKGALTCGFLRRMHVPLPRLDEQREIVAILNAIDRKIELHRRKRDVLDELFKALLHKLMTGEIRVTDLDLSALAQPARMEVVA